MALPKRIGDGKARWYVGTAIIAAAGFLGLHYGSRVARSSLRKSQSASK